MHAPACAQMRFVTRIAGLLGSPMVTDGIRARWMTYLVQMDAGLAAKACTPLHAECFVC